IKVGFDGIFHRFVPGESPNRANDPIPVNIPRENAIDLAFYISHNLFIGTKFQANYGLRTSIFKNIQDNSLFQSSNSQDRSIGDNTSKTFVNFEPRVYLQYKLSTYQQLHFAYNRNVQYLQLVQNDELSFSSLQTWIPSSANIAPQKADYLSLGYKIELNTFNVTLDGYYKKMYHQLELIDHAQIILNPNLERQLRAGKSDAYGTEINISKSWGKLNTEFSYTYSRVYKQIADINNNKPFQASYNVPHNFKLSSSYQFTPRLSLNSFFNYRTGRPVTLPVGYYSGDGRKIPIFGDRNSSRFADYSRLDLSIELKPKVSKLHDRHWQSTWALSVYNVYNKRNPLFYTIDNTTSVNNVGPGIVPSISYDFRF
ncbi:MAG: hypothetical protein JWP44_2434, partial [Mucilaginibacter sp.]|nr:hypothetical protein [Mucilaginibacter sp.]